MSIGVLKTLLFATLGSIPLSAQSSCAAGMSGGSVQGARISAVSGLDPATEALIRQKREEAVTCHGERLDPYEVWKDVRERENAEPFLRHNYERLGSVEGLADWLRCQGFFARVKSGPFRSMSADINITIQAYFTLTDGGEWTKKPLWGSYWFRFLQPVQHYISIYFDVDGNIRSLSINDYRL